MRIRPRAFTLIEVMLAVAIFAFAVVGFAVALNDVLGVNSEMMRTAQRRQAIESVAAQILAVSKELTETGWNQLPDWGSEETWTLWQKVERVEARLAGANGADLPPLGPWWQVSLRAQNEKGEVVDRVSFILWRAQ